MSLLDCKTNINDLVSSRYIRNKNDKEQRENVGHRMRTMEKPNKIEFFNTKFQKENKINLTEMQMDLLIMYNKRHRVKSI